MQCLAFLVRFVRESECRVFDSGRASASWHYTARADTRQCIRRAKSTEIAVQIGRRLPISQSFCITLTEEKLREQMSVDED